jgi:predicted O-methyltransferase YrrM
MAHRQRADRTPVIRQDIGSGVAELVPDPGRPAAWTLLVDGIPQSHVDLGDPGYLSFEYVRRLGHVIDVAAPPGEPLHVLHLGGGALTLARYVAATRPRSRQLAVDVDPALMEMVLRHLPLRGKHARQARPRVRIGDARQVVEHAPPGSFDAVITDVFASGQTPAHLTSAEFAAAVARALRPGGVYALNVADGGHLAHARAQAATMSAVFAQVSLMADPAVLRGRRFGNLVLTGGRNGLPIAELTRRAAGDPFPARVVAGAALERFAAGAKPVTDAAARPSPPAPGDVFGLASVRRSP